MSHIIQDKKCANQKFQIKYPIKFIETSLIQPTKQLKITKENDYSTSSKISHCNFNNSDFNALQIDENSLIVQSLSKTLLKFQGVLEEPVYESRLEISRLRHFEISFFIEDNSIQINEPKQRNSGLLQGIFLKRQPVFRRDKTRIIFASDFQIGETIEIAGHTILIHWCDEFTRRFYFKLNINQPENFSPAKDNFELVVLRGFDLKTDFGLNSYLNNGRVPSQRQFLENDRKVLKYFTTLEGNKYLLHYYLSDDRIEICEVREPNSGKSPFPIFLKRQKVFKDYKLEFRENLKLEEFIHYQDILPDNKITILNKKFYVHGCDLFTRQFYIERLNFDFPVFKFQEDFENSKPVIYIPPSNGFGSDEDTLQNVLKLIPKLPKKDYFSLVDNTGKLQFLCKLMNDDENCHSRFTD